MKKRQTVNIGSTPVPVISDAKAEKADYLVCLPDGPSPFTDNFKGVCCQCARPIMYRWHAPREPKRICVDCAGKLAAKEKRWKGVSQNTFDEVKDRQRR
jgi:hypothetical protein